MVKQEIHVEASAPRAFFPVGSSLTHSTYVPLGKPLTLLLPGPVQGYN